MRQTLLGTVSGETLSSGLRLTGGSGAVEAEAEDLHWHGSLLASRGLCAHGLEELGMALLDGGDDCGGLVDSPGALLGGNWEVQKESDRGQAQGPGCWSQI